MLQAAIALIIGVVLFVLILFMRMLFAPKKIQQLVSLLNQKRYDNLIRAAKKIITKDARDGTAHYLIGKAYWALNNMDMALVEYKTVNMLGKFDAVCPEIEFRKEMAQLFMNFDQNEEALKEFLMLIKLEPNVANHFYNIGFLFEQRESAAKAIGFYRKAIELNNKHSDSHFRLGHILYRDKKPMEAKVELEIAINNDANNYGAHFYIGRIKKDNHDYTGALMHFENAMKSQEYKLKAIVERGACFVGVNNFDKAIGELTRAIKLSTDDGAIETLYARFFLAHCYENTRKLDLAIEQWEKVYAKKPSFRNVAEKLSQYQELRLDDLVKDYLTSNKDHYMEICQSVVNALKLQIREVMEIPNGCQIIAVESETKWRNARKMPRLIRFYRLPDQIKDTTIRTLHEDMKKLNVTRGIVFTSSSYSKSATEFAQSRPIDLYEKEQLSEILIKASKNENVADV